MGNMGVWEEWTINVRKSLREVPAVLEEEVFYDVPSCLKNDQTRYFYHPKQISFGPRHFQPSGRAENLTVSENFKSEVARRFNGQLRERGIQSLAENLRNNMERLQKNYGIEVIGRLTEEDRCDGLSWMLARDGCFLVHVLDGFEDGISPQGQEEGTGTSEGLGMTVLQHILKRDNHHPLLTEIVKDVFKLENQLPLWVLEEVGKALKKPREDYWFEPALKNLSPIEVNRTPGSGTSKNNRIHILQLLGEYMIDRDPPPSTGEDNCQSEADNTAFLPGPTRRHGLRLQKYFKYIITMLRAVFALIFVLLLSPVLLIWVLWLLISSMRESYQTYSRGTAEEDNRHVPTIEELHSIGVKFKSLKGKGISHIHFNERKLTLYLPKFTVDDRSEVMLRNLLVMETQWKEKIITRYVVFMNDLVNTSVDVARLRGRGIIVNKLGSDEDVARLWNSVTIPATDIPRYEQIDEVSTSLNAYRRKWWWVLWAQFRSLHCSKPWLVASLLGGIALLSLTMVQVVCLFHHCSKPGK